MTKRIKTGGRKKGTPDKIDAKIKEAVAQKIATASAPEVDSLDRMRKMAMLLDTLAGNEFRKPETVRDVKLTSEFAYKAINAWDKVAKYEHPTLASIHVTREPLDPGTLTDADLAQLEGIVAKASVARSDQDREGETRH